MAERKYKSANVATQTDTFGAWVDRTNQIVFDMSEVVVTAQQNTVGGSTSGNVVITSNVYNQDTSAWVSSTGGIIQANTVAALDGLRGGNVQASNTLSITSNTNILGDTINVASQSTTNTVRIKGAYTDIQTTNVFVNNSLLQIKGDVHINSTSSNTSLNSTATHVTGTTFDINSATVDMDGTALTADYNDITLTANDITVKADGSTTVLDLNGDGTEANLTLSGNLLTVNSDESLFNANVILGSANSDTVSFNSEADTGLNPVSNALSLGLTDARWNLNSNTVSVSNTLSVTGNATFASDVDLGNASADTISINGKVDTNIIPTSNSKVLGATNARWDVNAEDINVSKTLLVTGTGDFSNTLDVVGAGTFSNTIAVTNTATFSNTITVTGAATLSNTLAVTNTATFSNTVGVTGATTLSNTLAVTNSVSFSNTLTVAGNAVFTTAANVGGLLRAKSNLIVTGTANASVAIHVGSANTKVKLSNNSIAVGNNASNSKLTSTTISTGGTLTVGGVSTLSGSNTDIAGHTIVSSNVVVGNVELNAGQITVGDASTNVVIDDSGNINADGNIQAVGGSLSGQLGVTGAVAGSNTGTFTGALATSNTFTANGLSTLKKGLTVTGIANVSSTLNVSGGLNVTGILDLNNRLEVESNATFQDSITVADNSIFSKTLAAGNTTVTGFVNATTTMESGGKITVGGNADITGSMTFGTLKSAIVHTGATANLVSGELYITDTGITATPNTTFNDDVTIVGDLEVQGSTSLSSNQALSLNVASMTTLSVSAESTLDGNTTIGNGSGTENLFVYAPVGNTTVGLIPGANGVPLGTNLKRYELFANTANIVSIAVGSQIIPKSNTVGQTLGTTSKRFVITANTGNFSGLLTATSGASVTGIANISSTLNIGANVNLSTTKITVGTSSVNTAITSSGIDADGTLAVGGAATLSSTLGVTGAATLSGNATIGTNSGDTRFSLNSANQYTMVLKNAGNIAGQIGGGGTDDLRFSNAAGATTMQIKGGHISAPLQPAFMAFKVGNQSVGASTVQVTGWNNNLDVGSNWDNTNNRYTVPTAGIYLAGGFYQASGTTGLHFGIYKNGAAYGNDSLLDVVDASANGYSVPFSMAANDYFTWVAYCSTTKTINQNRSKIWVIKVA